MHGRRINNFQGPQYVFRDPGFPLFEVRDSGFESKIGASFGIESMHGSGMPSITLGVKGLQLRQLKTFDKNNLANLVFL